MMSVWYFGKKFVGCSDIECFFGQISGQKIVPNWVRRFGRFEMSLKMLGVLS